MIRKSDLYIAYARPKRNDMAVIMVYYNLNSSIRIFQNLLFIKQKLEQAKIPFYIAEIAFDSRPYTLTPSANIIQLRSDSYLFYKENAADIVVRQLPPNFTKFCLLDADIIFNTEDWYDRLSSVLDSHDMCQCFERVHMLDQTLSHTTKTLLSYMHDTTGAGHEGFVWAFRRDYPLPTFMLVGSGDTTIALKKYKGMSNNYNNLISGYDACVKDKNKTYLHGVEIYHLYHGSLTNRGYTDRHERVREFLQKQGLQYLSEIMEVSPNGLYTVKSIYRARFNKIMQAYFSTRDDDGIEPNVTA